MSTLELTLGHGLVDTDGRRHRDAVLVAPDGRLEELLGTAVAVAPGAVHVPTPVRHRVLAECLDRVGGYERPDADLVAALTRGDGDLVALGVQRALLGPVISLVVRCPNPACEELADVDVDVDDLLPDVTEPEPEWFVADAGDAGQVELRAATGLDDLALDHLDGPDDERTAALMSLVLRGGATWTDLSPEVRGAALAALATRPLDPSTVLQVSCPACGAVIETEFDPLVMLARRLRAGGERLVLETHCLAFHYGWSQDAVLDLTRDRRWAYLALLRAQLTGAPLETAVWRG